MGLNFSVSWKYTIIWPRLLCPKREPPSTTSIRLGSYGLAGNWRSQAKQGACLLTDAPKILLLSRGLRRPLRVPGLLWTSDLTRLGPWQGLPDVYALSDGWNTALGNCIIAILAILGSAGVPEQKLLECHCWSPGRRFEGLRQRTVCTEAGPSRNCTVEEGCVWPPPRNPFSHPSHPFTSQPCSALMVGSPSSKSLFFFF